MLRRICVVAVCAGLLGVVGCAKSTPPEEDSPPTAAGEQGDQPGEPKKDGERPVKKKAATGEGDGFAGGVQVGEKAPGFSLQDQNGEQRTLEGLLMNGPVALVLFRSADW